MAFVLVFFSSKEDAYTFENENIKSSYNFEVSLNLEKNQILSYQKSIKKYVQSISEARRRHWDSS